MPPAGPARTADAVIFLPGVMGSELVDAQGNVVWGMRLGLALGQALFGRTLRRLALPADGRPDGIRASGLVDLPVKLPLLTSIEPYRSIVGRLERVVLRKEAFRVFAFDWRRSVVEAAGLLQPVARGHLAAWKRVWASIPLAERRSLPEPKLTLVAHSMGGLVCRWFAEVGGGRHDVRRIVTLGTPFAGSLNAARVLADGEYLPFNLFATALRDSGRTFPGLYELVARYRCVTGSGNLRTIAADDLAGIGASRPLAEAAIDVHGRLAAAVQAAGDGRCPVDPLVGVTQPTLQTVHFSGGTALFEEQLDGTDHRGDGTVYRYSAAPRDATPMPLPQTHGALAKSEEGIAFVEAVLTDRQLGEVAAPPGFGIRIPQAVRPGEQFDVRVVDADPGGTCRVSNAETGVQVTVAAVRRRGPDVVAEVTVPAPGLYRVEVAQGGYAPVQDLVMVIGD